MDTPINAVIGHSKDKAAADRLTESCVSQTTAASPIGKCAVAAIL